MFTLTIQTDNAAFDGGAHYETAHILRNVADQVATGLTHGFCYDMHGNQVGSFLFAKEGELTCSK